MNSRSPLSLSPLGRALSLPILATAVLTACMPESTQVENPQPPQSRTDRASGAFMGPEELVAAGLAREAAGVPIRLAPQDFPEAHPGLPKAAVGAKELLTFDDPWALVLFPNTSGYVSHPGYQQDVEGTNMMVWMSEGPGKGFAPAPRRLQPAPTDTFSYSLEWTFKCIRADGNGGQRVSGGACGSLPSTLDRWHEAQQGDTWLAIKGMRGGVRDRINLHRIEVRGDVPVTIWINTRSGWRYWPSLGKGRWTLPGATDIDEIQIRAASGLHNEPYSVDDIEVSLF